MARKINELTAETAPDNNDLLVLEKAAGGTRKLLVSDLRKLIINNVTAAHTLALTDAYCIVAVSAATACDLTIPEFAAVAFEEGAHLLLHNKGAGTVSVTAATTSVSISAGTTSLVTGGWMHVMNLGTDEWSLF